MQTPPVPAPANDTAPAPYYRAILKDLIEAGMDRTRAVHAAILSPEGGQPAEVNILDAALAYECGSRGVRCAMILARGLDHPPAPPAQHSAAVRRHTVGVIERAIGATRPGDNDRLEADLFARLKRGKRTKQMGKHPVLEVVAEICRDVARANLPGLPPWDPSVPADIVALCERAAEATGATRRGSSTG